MSQLTRPVAQRTTSWQHYAVGMAMLGAAVLAVLLAPSHFLAAQGTTPDLEKVIPQQFGGWGQMPQMGISQIKTAVPGEKTLSESIYDKTISRNYRGPNGELIMLAAAYGARQNDELKVHRPEVCYVSQGFQIVAAKATQMRINQTPVQVTQLIARNGARIEPITYWIRIGDTTMRGGMNMRLAILKAGLMGDIPDGLLMRVSSLVNSEAESEQAFRTQNEFLNAMLANANDADKAFLLGRNTER
ncbi:MAG TPA: EpsI family protein [Gallionella sp.]|nr:EpsI family protein [Gallionella sp.]